MNIARCTTSNSFSIYMNVYCIMQCILHMIHGMVVLRGQTFPVCIYCILILIAYPTLTKDEVFWGEALTHNTL